MSDEKPSADPGPLDREPRPLGSAFPRPKATAHQVVELVCLDASCRVKVFTGTLAVPLNACPTCQSAGVPTPKRPQLTDPTAAMVDVMLQQIERDKDKPYWQDAPHKEHLAGAKTWLQSLRDWLP